jgi:transcriptional regulator with XRE-family HTH domain
MDNTRPAAGIVKALRTLAGMSQRELAEASGVAASTIGRIESGRPSRSWRPAPNWEDAS